MERVRKSAAHFLRLWGDKEMGKSLGESEGLEFEPSSESLRNSPKSLQL